MQNVYQETLVTLAKYKVDFIVAGGVAAVLHGVERVTMDIDIALDMSEANLQCFLQAIDSLSLRPRVPVPIDFILDPENRKLLVEEKNALVFTYSHPTNSFFQLDVFLTEELSFPQLAKNSESIQLDSCRIRLVSIEKLIELKKSINADRPKDDYDIIELSRILESRVNEESK